jgi:hypothetical protein
VQIRPPQRYIGAACVAAAVALVPLAADAAKTSVKLPKSGTYNGPTGQHKQLSLSISGKSVDLAAFSFACKGADGRTSLNGIRLVKTKKGYAFALKAHGSITFSDDRPDENGKIDIAGRFTKTGKKATGTLRVRSSRCHTGSVDWRATR